MRAEGVFFMDAKLLLIAFAVAAVFLSGCTQTNGENLPPELLQMKQLCEKTGGSFTYCAPAAVCKVGTGCQCGSGKVFDSTLGCVSTTNELPPPPPEENETGPVLKCQDWVRLKDAPDAQGKLSLFGGVLQKNPTDTGPSFLMRYSPYRLEHVALGIHESPDKIPPSFAGKEVIITGEYSEFELEGRTFREIKVYEISDSNMNQPVPTTKVNELWEGAKLSTFKGTLERNYRAGDASVGGQPDTTMRFNDFSLIISPNIHITSDPLIDSLVGKPVTVEGVFTHFQLEGIWLDEIDTLRMQNQCTDSAPPELAAEIELCERTGGEWIACGLGEVCKTGGSCRCPAGKEFSVTNGCT
jgi:hypothetical protein